MNCFGFVVACQGCQERSSSDFARAGCCRKKVLRYLLQDLLQGCQPCHIPNFFFFHLFCSCVLFWIAIKEEGFHIGLNLYLSDSALGLTRNSVAPGR